MKTIYLAGGCFWGVEEYFRLTPGVCGTRVGYANGGKENVSYEEVKHGSGHAETVEVTYDENRITLGELLDKYFLVIDPLSVNKQGEDVGIQYRTGIYYTDISDRDIANNKLEELGERIGAKPVVELEELKMFCPAEEYHQKYLEKNPDGYCHIPKKMFAK